MDKDQDPLEIVQMGARVPYSIKEMADGLTSAVRPLGHPRAQRQDVIGALVLAADPQSVAAALDEYGSLLGKAIAAAGGDPSKA